MDVADAAPLNVAMPTPPASPTPEAAAQVEDSTPTVSASPSYPAAPEDTTSLASSCAHLQPHYHQPCHHPSSTRAQ
ncbi:hypothetical protein GQ457_05G022850 [Hibiscus cannabinus]